MKQRKQRFGGDWTEEKLERVRNNPLYLLCFASANPKGAKTAIKIAQDILKR